MPDLIERERRRLAAGGTPVRLADGQSWLFATPVFRPGHDQLTTPGVDRPLDRIFEHLVLDESVSLPDIWKVAIALLMPNYDLADAELEDLLSVAPGKESRELVNAVLDVLMGAESSRSYTDWVRASLLANGLGAAAIPAPDLPNVLAILVATHRTVPMERFVDACRAASSRSALETLI